MIELKALKLIGVILIFFGLFMAWKAMEKSVPFAHLDTLFSNVCPVSMPESFDGIRTTDMGEAEDCPRLIESARSIRKSHHEIGSNFLTFSIISILSGFAVFGLGTRISAKL
ncbi:MAG: hypothetical protein AB8D52_04575 [Gammaproteobacteria bacterium]